MTIKQGHRYAYQGWDCLALESTDGELVKVAPLDDSQPYPMGQASYARASELVPLPMSYFHGEKPV